MDDTEFEWPADTAMFAYEDLRSLLVMVQHLDTAGHSFLVFPEHKALVMSEDAARAIGAI